MKKFLNILSSILVIAVLGGCITIVQPTPAQAPTAVPTQAPTETQAPTPTMIPSPTEIPTEIQADDYKEFADEFVVWWKEVHHQLPKLKGVDLVGAEFLPDDDGNIWFTVGFTGSTGEEDINSDYYMMGVVTGLIKHVLDEGYTIKNNPFGVMIIFFANVTTREARCGAAISWQDMVDFSKDKITAEDLAYKWIYPILPDDTGTGDL